MVRTTLAVGVAMAMVVGCGGSGEAPPESAPAVERDAGAEGASDVPVGHNDDGGSDVPMGHIMENPGDAAPDAVDEASAPALDAGPAVPQDAGHDVATPDGGDSGPDAEAGAPTGDAGHVCVPRVFDCSQAGACGTRVDGCGGTTDCGACAPNALCEQNQCLYVPPPGDMGYDPAHIIIGCSAFTVLDEASCIQGITQTDLCFSISLHGATTWYQCWAVVPALPRDLCHQVSAPGAPPEWACCGLQDCS